MIKNLVSKNILIQIGKGPSTAYKYNNLNR